jgi:hypothetical protein
VRPAAVGAAIAALAVLVAAVKLLPVVDFMSEYPRHHGESDYLAAWQVWEVFLEAPLVRHRKGYFYVFGEYRNYLGPVAMAALPLMLLRITERARDFWMIAAAGALMLGDFAPWAPYALLSKLPVVGSLRVPVRYALLVDLHIGLVFGHALQLGADHLRRLPAERHGLRRLGVVVLVALFFGCALDLLTTNNQQHRNFFRDPDVVAPREGPFRMIDGRPHDVHHAPVRNEGHIRCYEPNPLRISAALKAFAPSEVYVPRGDGSVELVEWTPNRLRLRTDLPASRVVVVNMNHHRDWSAEGGTVRPWKGLLAVRVPAGQREVILTYRPRRILLYAVMTLIGLLSCGIGWWRLALQSLARV